MLLFEFEFCALVCVEREIVLFCGVFEVDVCVVLVENIEVRECGEEFVFCCELYVEWCEWWWCFGGCEDCVRFLFVFFFVVCCGW